eukprot:gnl/Trimastix_PCT/1339.p1 GENE.gnl/Trimastix_PCT/1339~~gnl/Trimastix_PCT/1339.p1  ORF type:complete len:338 (-),score=72.21 gnl/Trimastix_PCT/1339:342-1289(-)
MKYKLTNFIETTQKGVIQRHHFTQVSMWLYQISKAYSFPPSYAATATLFLARYLCRIKLTSLDRLNHIAVACFWLASKLDSGTGVKSETLARISRTDISTIVQSETHVLRILDYSVSPKIPHFVAYTVMYQCLKFPKKKKDELYREVHHMLDLAFTEAEFIILSPSILAASTLEVLFANKHLDPEPLHQLFFKRNGAWRAKVHHVAQRLMKFLSDLYRNAGVAGADMHPMLIPPPPIDARVVFTLHPKSQTNDLPTMAPPPPATTQTRVVPTTPASPPPTTAPASPASPASPATPNPASKHQQATDVSPDGILNF